MNVKLTNVRLSFPHLFSARAVNEGDKPKFSANFILDAETQKKQIAALEKGIAQVAEEHWKGKVPKGLKVCLRDGEDYADKDGYGEGTFFITASSDKRPPVVDRDMTPVAEEDDKIYAGCYVNVTVRLWAQDNKYGKRVNAALRAVQFVKDGEAFGAEPIDPDSEFEPLDEDDDEPRRPASKKAATKKTAGKRGEDLL